MGTHTVVLSPGQVLDSQLRMFARIVADGGEVSTDGLWQRIQRAAYVCLLTVDDKPAGVGALKVPTLSHRGTIEEYSGYSLEECSLELGWIVVLPQYRGRKLSAVIAKALLNRAGSNGVFCTVRADNLAIQLACRALGFVERGDRWPGMRGMLGLGIYEPGLVSKLLGRFL